jgi:predicted ribosome quality control (RQC) complex YloA/Tae2 family protein
VIPLDPRLGAVENAERYFRRYRKLRDARRRIPPLLLEARTELDRLQEIDTFVALAETEADLQAVRRELEPEEPKKKQAHPEKRGGRKRYTWEGYSALVGRTARENEEVTFRLAARDDLWLHARGRAGAHVVLRGPGEPGQDVVHAAAGLAGYFSSGRSDTAVDVDVARVRDVRKVAGGPPGKVTYRNFRTVRVPPSLGQWRPS